MHEWLSSPLVMGLLSLIYGAVGGWVARICYEELSAEEDVEDWLAQLIEECWINPPTDESTGGKDE